MKRKIIMLLLASMVILSSVSWNAQAQGISGLTSIRVALFVDIGKYDRATVPTVTLSSETGMDIFWLKDTNSFPYLSVVDRSSLRISPDLFQVLVEETKDMNKAQQVAEILSTYDFSSEVLVDNQKGESVFQVIVGAESSYENAVALKDRIALLSMLRGKVIGNLRWSAGTFTTEGEALNLLTQLSNSGFPVQLAMTHDGNGQLQYNVWVGRAATSEEFTSLYQEVVAAYPDINLQPVQQTAYLVKKYDAVFSGKNIEYVPHYYFSPSQVIIAKPRESSGKTPVIQVAEKNNRKYRGVIELRMFQDSYTVINELPFEEYLYGVVGSELATGWPLESLKVQAVIARTYALGLGNKYGIAHLSDTTFEQAYKGFTVEGEDIRRAVDSTRGEVITYNGKLSATYYYSNAGGMTAGGIEVWGNDVPYLQPVPSKDELPEKLAPRWFQIVLPEGEVGYVRSDFVTVLSEKSPLGFPYGYINTTDLNFRTGPSVDHESTKLLNPGVRVIIINDVPQDNAYSWIAGPFTSEQITKLVNDSMDETGIRFINNITSLEVTKRGPSGRVMEMKGNGQVIPVSSPDRYRSVFKENRGGSSVGLRSTLFEVEEMAGVTVLGAEGKSAKYPEINSSLAVISQPYGIGLPAASPNGFNDYFFAYSSNKQLRVVSKTPMFRFIGKGYGHGLGLSQFGARALAEDGYDYQQILKQYYSEDISITKIQ
ncbi:SpoIID/LytB domain-containing protein [Microaerobacter geothermalis]|uniref:SpoIID/LytB domain-containing protein n=1 Tax=Microaerobacter geothermalis TaxID=674972 RepID=UPI001F20CFA1|nr:SpoIID/LytB domain-containing protein [Microaerobacter geothermalis]MCF6092749.1 SpoIID/LytB domain-containing protein [Microaerobacter geothermalis]